MLTACSLELTAPEEECAEPAPEIAGEWRGTLDSEEMVLMLDEACSRGSFLGGGELAWYFTGSWSWDDLAGWVGGVSSPEARQVTLVEEHEPFSRWVTFDFTTPVANTIRTALDGSWMHPVDSTLISFDGDSITLTRQ